jgi:hypothetical protein
MFALGAAIVFGIGFLLRLFGQAEPAKLSLLYLGLTLLALQFAVPVAAGFRSGRRR